MYKKVYNLEKVNFTEKVYILQKKVRVTATLHFENFPWNIEKAIANRNFNVRIIGNDTSNGLIKLIRCHMHV